MVIIKGAGNNFGNNDEVKESRIILEF